jgi:hypothetical protein
LFLTGESKIILHLSKKNNKVFLTKYKDEENQFNNDRVSSAA